MVISMDVKEKFSEKTKRQLMENIPKNHCCRVSLLTGMMLCAKNRKSSLSDDIEKLKEQLSKPPKPSKKKTSILSEFSAPMGYKLTDDGKSLCENEYSVCNECTASLIRGCFIASGRTGHPDGVMYIELSTPNEKACTQLFELMQQKGLSPKRTVRRGENIIYFKKNESIEDLLNFIGAVSAAFELINAKIVSGIKRRAISMYNCDTSNISKTVDAASRQIAAINAIQNAGLMEALPSSLYETALIREKYPSESIEALIEQHTESITKSGVYHRLSKIVAFAEKKDLI